MELNEANPNNRNNHKRKLTIRHKAKEKGRKGEETEEMGDDKRNGQ